jgi:hypothetical protein
VTGRHGEPWGGVDVVRPVRTEEAPLCDICGLPFNAALGMTRVGHGDGTGQRFAHEVCYWRERALVAEARLSAKVYLR